MNLDEFRHGAEMLGDEVSQAGKSVAKFVEHHEPEAAVSLVVLATAGYFLHRGLSERSVSRILVEAEDVGAPNIFRSKIGELDETKLTRYSTGRVILAPAERAIIEGDCIAEIPPSAFGLIRKGGTGAVRGGQAIIEDGGCALVCGSNNFNPRHIASTQIKELGYAEVRPGGHAVFNHGSTGDILADAYAKIVGGDAHVHDGGLADIFSGGSAVIGSGGKAIFRDGGGATVEAGGILHTQGAHQCAVIVRPGGLVTNGIEEFLFDPRDPELMLARRRGLPTTLGPNGDGVYIEDGSHLDSRRFGGSPPLRASSQPELNDLAAQGSRRWPRVSN